MIIIRIRFLAGRFHATPWGRNVNEGIPEWPPSPYRLVRGLISVAKKKYPGISDSQLERTLICIQQPPTIISPEVTQSHVRYFMDVGGQDSHLNKKKIFDPFVAINPNQPVYFKFPVDPAIECDTELLNKLIESLSYLGRAESWVSATLTDQVPDNYGHVFEPAAGLIQKEINNIPVACPMPQDIYQQQPFIPPQKFKRKTKKNVDSSSWSWLRALCFDTNNFLDFGVVPPAMRIVKYKQPGYSRTYSKSHHISTMFNNRFSAVKFAMGSTVLPMVTDTVKIAEQVRRKLMGISKKMYGPDEISPKFSGKDRDGKPAKGHDHVFILPVDEDMDGRIDHIWIQSRSPFDSRELSVLDRLKKLYQSHNRPDIDLILETMSDKWRTQESGIWISATPFVTARHYRKGRGTMEEWLKAEVIKEIQLHGLPVPVDIQPMPETLTNPSIKWFEFLRSRKGQQPLPGTGWRLTFNQEIEGPFAIGALAHFGLGLFVPEHPET